MERLARVASLWNWLPAFRAVAETENVHEAARGLGVSPSSLSRSIGLLEERLAQPLFERGGRSMRLTPLGRELLEVVRGAMRAVDDATAHDAGALRVACPADLVAVLVVPLLGRLPAATARVSEDPDDEPVARLLRGELDLVLGCDPIADHHVITEEVAAIRLGLYTGEGGAVATSLEDALRLRFASYRAPGGPIDHWASAVERRIALELVDARDAALAACDRGLLVALPDRLAAGLGVPLVRLPVELGPPVPVHATRRRTLGPIHPADVLLAALRAR